MAIHMYLIHDPSQLLEVPQIQHRLRIQASTRGSGPIHQHSPAMETRGSEVESVASIGFPSPDDVEIRPQASRSHGRYRIIRACAGRGLSCAFLCSSPYVYSQ
jgi:hypothetical protein